MPESLPPTRPRLASLDVFRGLTVSAMILVNNPGSWDSVYPPLRHAEWNGCTPADLVFPFFLYIVGVSLAFSCQKRRDRGDSRAEIMGHALWRSLALIGLGLLCNGLFFLPWDQVRIPGVLQRIGVVYGLTLLLVLTTTRRLRGAITVALLGGYWLAMTLLPLPGHGAGDLTPAGNLASRIDCHLLHGHMWTPRGDPEGFLSTLPAIATALLGTFAGDWLLFRRANPAPGLSAQHPPAAGSRPHKLLIKLLFTGAVILLLGLSWGRIFPLNKTLWTSSFAFFTAGWATLLLAFCYWLVDVKGWGLPLRPFESMGRNPLAIYVAAQLGSISVLNALPNAFHPVATARLGNAPLASLLWAVLYVSLFICLACILHRRGIVLKL